MEPQSCVMIQNEWDIVGARQLGREMAKDVGFSAVDQARIATAISELARNIYLYAEQGSIKFEIVQTEHHKAGLCLMAEDDGPGISDISEVLKDGFSTSGGLGAGLPGVRRLMDEFEIHSEVGKGTKITAIKWLK